MSLRKASVAGTFYPASCSEIKRYIEHFNTTLDDAGWVPKNVFRARALISPHAGYVYSGFSANAAYRSIAHLKPKRIVVLGPSHRVLINGASIAKYDRYETPCKELDIDVAYSKKIEDRFGYITFDPKAHSEHSTETQIPFIDHYFKNVPYSRNSLWKDRAQGDDSGVGFSSSRSRQSFGNQYGFKPLL